MGAGRVVRAFVKSLLLSLVREKSTGGALGPPWLWMSLGCQPQPLELVRADVRFNACSDTRCAIPTTGGVTGLPSDMLKSGCGKPRTWEEPTGCKIRELKVREEWSFQHNDTQGVVG